MRLAPAIVVIFILGATAFYIFRAKVTTSLQRTEIAEGIDPSEIIEVVPRDAIPAIDSPKFETVATADEWLEDNDLVFGLEINGLPKAFPQRILNWHEIVNNPEGVIVTFCPLCGSAVAFKSPKTTFGVSGKLYNSDLVMYDRASESLWSQITGKAIAGKLVGQKLELVSIQTLPWAEWKRSFPDSQILSRDTGFSRNYDLYPYGDYETSRDINYPVKTRDSRLHEKAIVWGVSINGAAKAYPEDKLKSIKSKITDKIGDNEVELYYRNGKLEAKRLDDMGEVVPIRNFWFAWVAFYPTTELY